MQRVHELADFMEEALDGDLSGKLMSLAKTDALTFYVLTTGRLAPPRPGGADPLGVRWSGTFGQVVKV